MTGLNTFPSPGDHIATFETFARRARQRDLGPTRGMAKDLLDADPDEVSR